MCSTTGRLPAARKMQEDMRGERESLEGSTPRQWSYVGRVSRHQGVIIPGDDGITTWKIERSSGAQARQYTHVIDDDVSMPEDEIQERFDTITAEGNESFEKRLPGKVQVMWGLHMAAPSNAVQALQRAMVNRILPGIAFCVT